MTNPKTMHRVEGKKPIRPFASSSQDFWTGCAVTAITTTTGGPGPSHGYRRTDGARMFSDHAAPGPGLDKAAGNESTRHHAPGCPHRANRGDHAKLSAMA
jgi:hypothetical protein